MSKDKDETQEENGLVPPEEETSANDFEPTPDQIEEAFDDAELDGESLEEQLTRVKSEADEYLDGWQRARAEFANYKKRVEREVEESRQRITSEIIVHYLKIMDDLERALDNIPDETDLHEWISGIALIHQKFESILEAEGVERIEAEGERFDPNLHEAISYEESDDFEGGSIIAVTQRGYSLGDRIIRPAMVRVAK